MKKLLSSLLAAAVAMQCGAVSCLAAWKTDTVSKTNLCSADFSAANELSTWDTQTVVEYNADNAPVASISADSLWDMTAPYLTVTNPTANSMADQKTFTKSFTVPADQTGLIRTSFKFSNDHGAANADIRLTDDSGNGIIIGTGDEGQNSPPVYIDGELQQPYGNEPYRVYVVTKSGESYSTSYALGNAFTFDLGATGWGKMWRNVEVVANTTDKKVSTTIADRNITLGKGIYAVALTLTVGSETTTNILRGYLPEMGNFSKFTIMSKGWISNGVVTRLDDLSVDFEPIEYVNDAEFANWKGVVWGELDEALSDSYAKTLILSDAADMSDLGVGWTRIFVGRNYNQSRIESMIRAAHEKGVKVLMTYIKKTGSTEYGTADEEAEEMAYLKSLVNKYKGITRYWEIGNEPNISWLDSARDSAKLENYAKHLRDCYNTIKATDESATVILGGLSEYYSEDWVSEFAKLTIDGKPAYSYLDEVAYHPYRDTPQESLGRVTAFKDAMKTSWGIELPIWITEIGFHATASWDKYVTPGKVETEEIKAQYLTAVMNGIHELLSSVQRPVMWYQIHEKGGGVAGYGLTQKTVQEFGVDKTTLPAYAAMKGLITEKAESDALPISENFSQAAGTLPNGWTSNLSGNTAERYVSISNDPLSYNTAYLKISKQDGKSADEITADRAFALPEYGGLISLSFDYVANGENKGYGKKIKLMNGDTDGIVIENGWFENGNNIAALGLSGDGDEPTVLGDEVVDWRHFEFVINCSNETLGGLAPGEYTLSYNNNTALKGKMKNNLTSLNKIRFTSGAYVNADIGIDTLNISVKDVPSILEISTANAANGQANITFSSSKSSVKGDICIAAYKDNAFSRMVYMQKDYIIPKGDSTIEASLGNAEDGESYKVFVWDTVDSMKPVMNSKSF